MVHVGDDAYLMFAVQNRDRGPYRVASVTVLDGAADRAGVVRFVGDATEAASDGVIGVVRPGGRGVGVVMVRHASELTGRALALVVAQPQGRGQVTVGRIVLR